MIALLTQLLLIARSRPRSRASLEAENLVLRQQVIVLSRKSRSRVWFQNIDRFILVWLAKTGNQNKDEPLSCRLTFPRWTTYRVTFRLLLFCRERITDCLKTPLCLGSGLLNRLWSCAL